MRPKRSQSTRLLERPRFAPLGARRKANPRSALVGRRFEGARRVPAALRGVAARCAWELTPAQFGARGGLPSGESGEPGKDGGVAELLLDPQQLVVLRD